jgi:iron complex outermembrane receptor protein
MMIRLPARMHWLFGVLTGSLCFVGSVDTARAANANASDTQLEEVVVTATKREERLIDVPASVQAVSEADLQRQGSDVFADYARSLAGVSFVGRGAGQTQIAIRGVTGGVDLDVGPQSTVGVYVDEVPISEGMAQPDLRIFDIERVELLRGPQGTLYGSGSMGGTLRIITRKPDLEDYSGSAETTLSDTHGGGVNYGAALSANIPLIRSEAGLRLDVYGRNNDGFIDDLGTGRKNENAERTAGGRAQLRYKPSDEWTIDGTLIGQRSRYDSLNGYDPLLGDLLIKLDNREPYSDDLGIGNLTIGKTGTGANFLSSTSYTDRERTYVRDTSAFFSTPSSADYGYGTRVWTEELRMSSPDPAAALKWVTGLYYSSQIQSYDETIDIPGVGAVVPGYPDGVVFVGNARTTTKESAIFADASYRFAPQWTLELGLRGAHAQLDSNRVDLTPGPLATTATRSSNQVLPKFNLSFKPSDPWMLYGQVSKGYRIGGGNIPVPPLAGQPLPPTTFGPDSLWSYELGVKYSALDGHLALTSAVFYIDWKQVPVQFNRIDGYSYFINGGDATSKGSELDLAVVPIEHLTVHLNATYLDSTLNRVNPGVNATPGEPLPAVPRWSGGGSIELTLPSRGTVTPYVRLDDHYVGGSQTDFGAIGLPMGNYWLANLRTGLRWNAWQADLFIDNLADKRPILYVNQFGGDPRRETSRPRTIGATIRFKF